VALLALPTGDLLVAEKQQNRIFRLPTREGDPVRLVSPSPPPVEWTALSLAPGLSFYALDGPGNVVHQYDFRGNYLGVALDVGALAQNEELGPLEISGMAVERSGQALLTDRQGDRLLVFGPGWVLTGILGQTGSDPGSWRRPGPVSVGDRPPYLVADPGNLRVVLLDGLGEVLAHRELPEEPSGVAVLGEGLFAVARGATVEILDARLAPVETFSFAALCPKGPFASGALVGMGGVVLAGEGCTGRLQEFRRRG
jgi:hypothetical protein